jgi:hypothetical protein
MRIHRLPSLALPLLCASALLLGACRVRDAEALSDDEPSGDRPVAELAAHGDYRITGPYVHENLTVFLIHGADRSSGTLLTLQEAMAAKTLVVHETSNVNELEVENLGDEEVFIQASEIVKGGKQDRVMAIDMIVPPKSGRVPIAAFCVEHGRWQKRGDEDASMFAGSSDALSSKELKIAAKYDADQNRVWNAVSESQAKLERSVGAPVADARSASSLQLTLENGDVAKLTDEYVAKLAGLVEGKDDVIGYAFAVNGVVNSADVYGSAALFRKLWPKMLRAAAVEAIAERGTSTPTVHADAADIAGVIADAERGRATRKPDAGKARGYAFESEKNLLFETRADDDIWVHRNYVTK